VLTGSQVFQQLEPISKKDRVVAVLKEAIVSGAMKPGDAIVENKVAQQLGVGQPLVREALIELEHQGFVQRFPYRGTYVTQLNQEDIEQIFTLRIKLEALAIDWAKQNARPEDIETLKHYVRLMLLAAQEHDIAQFYKNDLAFHRKIWELSGNRYLAEALERVVAPLFAFFVMKTIKDHKSYEESAEMHEKIVEAIPLLEAAELREFMEKSLGGWRDDMLVKLLPDNQ
jgi:DNA-binding GntR family transcriptional regulator